jgi:hypothetical protein
VRTTTSTGDGVRIKRDWRSVGLGYARIWLPFIAVAIPAVRMVSSGLSILPLAVSGLMLVAFAATFGSGRLPEQEKARLRLLGTVTGLKLDPTRLLPAMRDVKRELLGQLMKRAGIPIAPDEILSVLEDIPIPAMPLVYGYARYASDDKVWRDCADAVYARYLLAEV